MATSSSYKGYACTFLLVLLVRDSHGASRKSVEASSPASTIHVASDNDGTGMPRHVCMTVKERKDEQTLVIL